ncbi:UDP-glucose,sterol transferase [Colletotrichum graminicola]|nr:UDP-glucose,sterol transferase [Colletotrichum graminicola]
MDVISDPVMKPVTGGQHEGAIGAFEKVDKSAASLVAKSGAGMFELLTYLSAGIAKSFQSKGLQLYNEDGCWGEARGGAIVNQRCQRRSLPPSTDQFVTLTTLWTKTIESKRRNSGMNKNLKFASGCEV